jgi:glyoxylase-like metal-dependent hydrolase (beta-lactamase superfamily II)
MTQIKTEGKFNENSYLIDAEFFKVKETLALYVIENKGERMLIDTGEILTARKIVNKLKDFGIYPIHKILLSHAHWDHIQALPRIKKLIKDVNIEVLASMNAIDVLKNPERMNKFFGYDVEPIEGVTSLKENDIINLNGLMLKVINFFGHTQDSIAVYDEKNRNIFVGDAIIDKVDENTFVPVLFGPSFNEKQLLDTYKKLKSMKSMLDSISLAHYGIWQGEDFSNLVNELENLHLKTKKAIIQWYKKNPSQEYITLKYLETFIPNSKIFTKESIFGLQWNIKQIIDCLKSEGSIK